MAFATSADFAALVGRTLSTAEETQVDLLLELAEGAIKGWTRQEIEKVTGDTAKLEGTWGPDLELPERPVLAVGTVKINGITVPTGGYAWNERQLLRRGTPQAFDYPPGWGDSPYDWGSWPAINAPTGYFGVWGGPAATVEVTYDHGYEQIPEDVKVACLSIAMRYQVIFTTGADLSAGLVLSDADKAVLRRYRRWWN